MKEKTVLGIDIGGSHITAALVNLSTRSILEESLLRSQINSKGTAAEILDHWKKTIEEVVRNSPLYTGKQGIAIPGPFDYQKGISLMKDQDKFDALYGLNVKQLLAEQLQIDVDNIRLVNDAQCFLQGEVYGGIARGCNSAIGLTLGTGLGSARFRNGIAEDADLWCSPFKGGIAEDYLSSRWFIMRFQELTGNKVAGVKELAQEASACPKARQIFHEFGENLAHFLEPLLLTEKPDVVVLGGNIAKAYDLFSSTLHQTLGDACIKLSGLGEQASLLGAASYWDETPLQH